MVIQKIIVNWRLEDWKWQKSYFTTRKYRKNVFVIVITEKLMYIGTEIDLILGRRYMVSSEKRCKRGRGQGRRNTEEENNWFLKYGNYWTKLLCILKEKAFFSFINWNTIYKTTLKWLTWLQGYLIHGHGRVKAYILIKLLHLNLLSTSFKFHDTCG